jgi:hypothetical protein
MYPTLFIAHLCTAWKSELATEAGRRQFLRRAGANALLPSREWASVMKVVEKRLRSH